jgi:hypothetical protein
MEFGGTSGETMISVDNPDRCSLDSLLGTLTAKGVRLWVDSGQLRYRAPKGALSRPEIEQLARYRDELVMLVQRQAGDGRRGSRLGPRRPDERVPLSYGQQVSWEFRLRGRSCKRQIASATCLRGRLNVSALRASLYELVRRHEALRTCIVVRDDIPEQIVEDSVNVELRIGDLSRLDAHAAAIELQERIRELILEPFGVDQPPLFAVQLIRLRENEHVLVIGIEHIISDAYSIYIFLRDLLHIYARTLRGGPPLPPVPVHFADYTVWRRNGEAAWVAQHREYWDELRRWPLLRFPEPRSARLSGKKGWEGVPIVIDAGARSRLVAWCQAGGTTLAMGVFVVYAATVLRWCGASQAVIRYVTNGRIAAEIEDAIGPFATWVYVRLAIGKFDNFLALLEQATREYCTALHHAEFSYLSMVDRSSEVLASCIFNWIPADPGLNPSLLDASEEALICTDVPFENPVYEDLELESEPMLLLHDRENMISGAIMFPRKRFSNDTMQQFARVFLTMIDAALSGTSRPIGAIPIDG